MDKDAQVAQTPEINGLATRTALAEHRAELEAEIDASIERSDLFEAAMGSYEHALVSFELGDLRSAQSHAYMGTVLASLDIALIPYGLPEAPTDFRPRDDLFHHSENPVVQAMRERLDDVLVAAETEVDVIDADPIEKNTTLLEAVNVVTDILVNFRMPLYDRNRPELLELAKRLADHMTIDFDRPSTELAFKAVEKISLTAFHEEGRTLSTLIYAKRRLEEIKNSPHGNAFAVRCDDYLADLNSAILFKLKWNAVLPFVQLYQAYTNSEAFPVKRDETLFSHSRVSRDMQKAAKLTYLAISDPNQFWG